MYFSLIFHLRNIIFKDTLAFALFSHLHIKLTFSLPFFFMKKLRKILLYELYFVQRNVGQKVLLRYARYAGGEAHRPVNPPILAEFQITMYLGLSSLFTNGQNHKF